jgi:hypothetical protein
MRRLALLALGLLLAGCPREAVHAGADVRPSSGLWDFAAPGAAPPAWQALAGPDGKATLRLRFDADHAAVVEQILEEVRLDTFFASTEEPGTWGGGRCRFQVLRGLTTTMALGEALAFDLSTDSEARMAGEVRVGEAAVGVLGSYRAP